MCTLVPFTKAKIITKNVLPYCERDKRTYTLPHYSAFRATKIEWKSWDYLLTKNKSHIFILEVWGFFCDFDVDGTNSMEQIQDRNPSVLTMDIAECSWRNRGASLLVIFLTCVSSVNHSLSKFFSTSLWILNIFWITNPSMKKLWWLWTYTMKCEVHSAF